MRKRGRIREFLQNPSVILLASVCAVILVYAVFAYPFYTAVKIREMKEAYRTLSGVNLAEISEEDEEDGEILQGFSDDKLEVMITDEDFHLLYTNRIEQPARREHIVERYMIPYKEEFQEDPNIYIREVKNFRVIRLRGLLSQGEDLETEAAQGEGKKEKIYYVYIRLVVHSAGKVIRYTTKYLCAAATVLIVLGYLLLRLRSEKLALVPAQAGREAWHGAEYKSGARSTAGAGSGKGDRKAREMENASGESPGKAGSSEEDMKARQEFVASVSHELKTPLAVISGQMEMLQSMGDRIDQNYYFTSIREEIDKMSELVGNLLDLTIMEHQMEDMELREMDFSGMVKYMTQKYDALFQRNHIILRTEIEEGCIVYGNRTYLEQAVNNYIMNAFQHTMQDREIWITLARENGSAKLCVYNEGSLIPSADLDRIWKGFYKESGSSRTNLREFRNAGLGLYFVRKITEIHHGDCGVRNMKTGVEFWLTLPLMGQ